jgi:hypothetical protein
VRQFWSVANHKDKVCLWFAKSPCFNFLILSFCLKDLMQVGECSFLQFYMHGNLEGNHVICWDQFGKSNSLPHLCMEISSPPPFLFICFFFFLSSHWSPKWSSRLKATTITTKRNTIHLHLYQFKLKLNN